MASFILNGKQVTVEQSADMPLLWTLRDVIGATGTKFGCGIGACGACTVHLDGKPVRACITPLSAVEGKQVTTIEGIASDTVGQRVQAAWRDIDVVQCGYCQPGQIMSAVALLKTSDNPSDSDIDGAMAGNICRCGTYHRIRLAIKKAAGGKEA